MTRRGAVAVAAAAAVVVALALVVGLLLRARGMSGPVEDAPGTAATARPTVTSTAVDEPVPDTAGCPPTDLSDRPSRAGAETGPVVGDRPDGGRLCAYDRGRLTGSHLLTTHQAIELADAVRAGPDGIGPEGLGCPRQMYDYIDGYAEPHFTAHLTYADEAPTDLWVYGNVCTPAGVVNGVGRFARLGPALPGLLARLVRTPRPFPVTDAALPPGPVPRGPLTDAECSDGIVSGVPDWFGGEPVAVDPGRRAIRMSKPLLRAFPGSTLRQAGRLATAQQLSWLRPSGARVGWFRFERLAVGGWSLRDWQSCSPPRDEPGAEKPRSG